MQQVFTNRLNKPIGHLEDNTFYKKVKKSKHFMRIYEGWGLDEKVFNQIKGSTIRILDEESGIVYATDWNTFNEKGIRGNFDGKQVFLGEKYFNKEVSKQNKLI